jgi:hypothetical protein
VRTLRFVVLWWLALAGWWLLLVGTNAGLEELAGACAAVLGTGLALGARQQRLLRFRFEPRWLAKSVKEAYRIVQEFGVVFWALALQLARVRPVDSAYRAIPFPAGRADAVSAGRRAIATLVDCLSPNTLPIDIDTERGVALRHELEPRRTSNEMP